MSDVEKICGIQCIANPRHTHGSCPDFLSRAATEPVRHLHQSIPAYNPTPLTVLPSLAQMLGIGAICIKDESKRFGLNAFKGLGGTYALCRVVCDKLGLVNRYFEGLRPLTAVEAGQALRVADALDVSLTVEGDTAAGRCNGFTGSAYCYLRTDKDPQVDNETCRISPVCGGYEGCWYLVEILQPEFSFSLKE